MRALRAPRCGMEGKAGLSVESIAVFLVINTRSLCNFSGMKISHL
jgi:hypothetical protein